VDGTHYPKKFSPDGLTEPIIDASLPLVWPRDQLPDRVLSASGTGSHRTRSGGSNRQERAYRTGAPQSPATATKEIGMLQLQACVTVRCDQCGISPGRQAHYPTEDAALDAATADGWQVDPAGRLWCSACATVLTCEAEGHEFSAWHRPVTSNGQPALSEYRHCQRCCLVDSRPAHLLIGSKPSFDKSAEYWALLDAVEVA
jgi:hypothetical protein